MFFFTNGKERNVQNGKERSAQPCHLDTETFKLFIFFLVPDALLHYCLIAMSRCRCSEAYCCVPSSACHINLQGKELLNQLDSCGTTIQEACGNITLSDQDKQEGGTKGKYNKRDSHEFININYDHCLCFLYKVGTRMFASSLEQLITIFRIVRTTRKIGQFTYRIYVQCKVSWFSWCKFCLICERHTSMWKCSCVWHGLMGWNFSLG